MAKFPFEKSKKDVEVRGKGKEGSKREERFDARQKAAPVGAPAFKKGGVVKGKRGC